MEELLSVCATPSYKDLLAVTSRAHALSPAQGGRGTELA